MVSVLSSVLISIFIYIYFLDFKIILYNMTRIIQVRSLQAVHFWRLRSQLQFFHLVPFSLAVAVISIKIPMMR